MANIFEKIKPFITKRNVTAIICALLVLAIIATTCLIVSKKPEPTPETKNETTVQTDNSDVSKNDDSMIPEEDSQKPIVESKPEIELVISAPTNDDITVTSPNYTLSGSSDPEEDLLLNGEKIERNLDGTFSLSVQLEIGANSFKFEHKGKTITKTIRYRYVIIKSYEPAGSKAYSSGSILSISVLAREGSTVTATLGNSSITCEIVSATKDDEEGFNKDDTFVNYGGTFRLPTSDTDKNLGKITIKAVCNGASETVQSGNITVKKSSIIKGSDPSVTPNGGNYVDVGSGLIATIKVRSAETFNGNTTDDDSRPYNNYLPEGTQDYCAEGLVTNGKKEYYKLRCGKRIYTESNPGYSYNQTVATTSIGLLPDHNEIGIESFVTDGKYTLLTLQSGWKAPFYFEVLNQSYQKSRLGYSISSVTFSYVDITFCYTTLFEGELIIPDDHPIFSKAEIIKNEHDYTLRLTLKKTGGLYGWDCYYDENDNLVFKFLNPAKMEDENSLANITVYIDVGHGGSDGGASVGKTSEAHANLLLAKKLKEKLEGLGATVIMNRTDNNTSITPPERMNKLRNANADFCIAIHQDSSTSSSPNGFFAAYFTPFSKIAADYIAQRTENAGIYKKIWAVESHYYYVSRVTSCPVVLTENGFMSNSFDYNTMVSDSAITKKATAMAEGILDYFRSIQ